MKLKYKVEEEDFLALWIFEDQKLMAIPSAVMIFVWIIINVPIFWLIGKFGNMFIPNAYIILAFIYLVIVIIYLFRLIRIKTNHKVRRKLYQENFDFLAKDIYSGFFDEIAELEFNENGFFQKNLDAKEKITLPEVEKVNETLKYFFVSPKGRFSWVIPKRDLDNLDEIKAEFKRLGLELEEHLDWE